MQIELTRLGKRYNRHWIFRGLDKLILSGSRTAIAGANGSGKSTLLQVIGGSLDRSEGSVKFIDDGQAAEPDDHFALVGFCTPYLELPEELSLVEFLEFHGKFKQWLPGLDASLIIDIMGLQKARDKWVRDFSSGMKQRVKLAQALMTTAPVVLLDEPTSNLDEKGIGSYFEWVEKFTAGKTLLVASNDAREIDFCNETILISDYWPQSAAGIRNG